MCSTQRCFLASRCSKYCRVLLRAPRIENPAVHCTSLPSRRIPVNYAGYPTLFTNLPLRPAINRVELCRQPERSFETTLDTLK